MTLTLDITACQDYFTHFESSQLLGGTKKGGPLINKSLKHWITGIALFIWVKVLFASQQYYSHIKLSLKEVINRIYKRRIESAEKPTSH